MEFAELREAVCEANLELHRRGVVFYTFGNVSQIDRARGAVAIKPSGVPYEKLKPEDIVVVGLDNRVLSGTLRPSSDTKTHTHLYRAWPEVGGIAHTHSTYATAWAQAARAIPCYGTTHADYVHGPIPCASFLSGEQVAGDYEEETGVQLAACLGTGNRLETPMALAAGHGPFTWGKDAAQSVFHAVVLEELARLAALTCSLDSLTPPLPEAIQEKHYQRKHGPKAYYGQAL